MATEIRGGWFFPLRVKLVAVLIAVMVVSMVLATAGLGKFLKEFF